MEDDIYKGYFIPAGTTVIANVWCVHTHFSATLRVYVANTQK